MKEKNVKYSIDFELVKEAQANKASFSVLYEKYFEKIYLFIYKRTGQKDLSGDICQTTMLKAMLNLHKYEDRGFLFVTWLYRIASNEVNLYFRRTKKRAEVEIHEKDIITLMGEIEIDDKLNVNNQDLIVNLLNDLKPEHTEIIELRFFFDYSFKEIAEFYNISEANAKMRLYRLLDKIKKSYATSE